MDNGSQKWPIVYWDLFLSRAARKGAEESVVWRLDSLQRRQSTRWGTDVQEACKQSAETGSMVISIHGKCAIGYYGVLEILLIGN